MKGLVMKTRDALGLLVGLLWLSALALHVWAGVGFFVVLFWSGFPCSMCFEGIAK